MFPRLNCFRVIARGTSLCDSNELVIQSVNVNVGLLQRLQPTKVFDRHAGISGSTAAVSMPDARKETDLDGAK